MPKARHITLVAATPATVVLELGRDEGQIEVINVDGLASIYFTVNGSTPTVEGDDTYVLPAAIGSVAVASHAVSGTHTVKLISAGTPKVSVAESV